MNSTIYFLVVVKVFGSPLSEGYNVRNLKFSWKLLIDFSAIASTELWSFNYLNINFYKNNLENN